MASLSEKKVILIAPDDVENELEAIRTVVEQANQLRLRERLTVWNWRTDATPGMHLDGPQGLTDEQMRISESDLVVAVFWSRLGTPVKDELSGTAHELNLAWRSWKSTGKPTVWIYFCTRAIPQSACDDEHQFPRLRHFRKSLPKEQSFSEFESIEELQRDFTKHLGVWLDDKDPGQTEEPAILNGVLAPPDAARMVQRPREIERVAASLREAPIVCLHGISGSGKTRLAAQYGVSPLRLAEHARDLLWYEVSPGGTLEEVLAMLPQELVGPADLSPLTRSKNLLTTLRLRRQLLVLDDFHEADRTSFSPLLRVAGIQSSPAVILLLSRVALYVPDTTEIAVRAWTVAEVRGLLEQLGMPALSDELLLKLTAKTGGLPLAVRFFWVLVKEFGRDPKTLLEGELSQTPLTESWYGDITAELSPEEQALLRYVSLAEPYVTEPVLKRAQARLPRAQRVRAFMRLQTLLLVESRGSSRWAVHPFVAEHTLNDTDDVAKSSMLRDLCKFSRDGIRNLRPNQMTHQSLVAGIRAARYAQRAKDARESHKIITSIASAAKRLGYYRSLRELCQWQMAQDGCDPWVKYHFAHCELILGKPRHTVAVLSGRPWSDRDAALGFASARILADAQSQLGDPSAAISGLRDALKHSPGSHKGAVASCQQAKAMLVRLLTDDGSLAEARNLAGELARSTWDERSLAVIVMHLGRLDAANNPQDAERRFRLAMAKFRSVGDRRGCAWASRSLAEVLIRQGRTGHEVRRLVRESVSICSRTGECTLEYSEWLQQMRKAFAKDAATLNLIDHEVTRVSSDLGFSAHG
ncbi:NB-ARC domain-containing protein [Streptomyces sp. NPDC059002]|uniref:NB-ARC domain-containing protein n=1 Tax=Streptomyces sp. NPDC059002 TaxID=3346690 RepID=UPI0036783999